MKYGLRHAVTISNVLKPGGGVKAWGWTDCSLTSAYVVSVGAPALPQHHGPIGLPRMPQYDAVHAHEHAVQPRGHVVQSAVTRMRPESEEEEGRHAEPTAYLSQGVSGPVQRRVQKHQTGSVPCSNTRIPCTNLILI